MSNPSKLIRASVGAAILSLMVLGAPPGGFTPAGIGAVLHTPSAHAAETSWKEDFDDICSKTQDAMSLSPDELRGLLNRCDELKVKVDALEGAAKKVALKRLQMCRDLYAYVLDQKEKK